MRISFVNILGFIITSANGFSVLKHYNNIHKYDHQILLSRISNTKLFLLDENMEKRLDGIRRSFNELTERLGDPDVINDQKLMRQVMLDRSKSEDVVSAYEEYSTLKSELLGAKELFNDSSDDAEMREMARAEMKEIEEKIEELEAQITILLLPQDPNDGRDCMLEIRAGTGGSEANLFAGDLLDLYRKFVSTNGWSATVIESSDGDDGGYKSVTLQVRGQKVYSKLK